MHIASYKKALFALAVSGFYILILSVFVAVSY